MLTGIKWLQIAIGAVAGFALCWLIHLVILAGVEETHGKALNDQKTQLEAQCAEHKAITERANDDLQNEYAAIARKLADAQRLRPARCVVPTARPPVAPAGGGEHAGQDGISSDWLRHYAAECEGYRAERLILERFMDAVWE